MPRGKKKSTDVAKAQPKKAPKVDEVDKSRTGGGSPVPINWDKPETKIIKN